MCVSSFLWLLIIISDNDINSPATLMNSHPRDVTDETVTVPGRVSTRTRTRIVAIMTATCQSSYSGPCALLMISFNPQTILIEGREGQRVQDTFTSRTAGEHQHNSSTSSLTPRPRPVLAPRMHTRLRDETNIQMEAWTIVTGVNSYKWADWLSYQKGALFCIASNQRWHLQNQDT